MNDINVFHGDCLEVMKLIPDDSIDMVLADPPYVVTGLSWDNVIPLVPMWAQLKRVCKKSAAIVIFGKEPFSSHLRLSNLRDFKYDYVWDKKRGSNFASVKYVPFFEHEMISVFYSKRPTYNPQRISRSESSLKSEPVGSVRVRHPKNPSPFYTGMNKIPASYQEDGLRMPRTVLEVSRSAMKQSELGFHPTQKPLELMDILVKTYTNEGDTVLDFCMGSGTTGVSCLNNSRRFVGIEKEEQYFNVARRRLGLS